MSKKTKVDSETTAPKGLATAACSARLDQYKEEQARRGIELSSDIQRARIVAHHYASNAMLAKELCQVINDRENMTSEQDSLVIDEFIKMVIDQINKDSLATFGRSLF